MFDHRQLSLWLLLLPALAQAYDVTLSWTPPTQNDDGTPLTDLGGYRIFYGCTQSGEYDQTIEITDPAITSHVVEVEGRCFFAATAFNTSGLESAFSNEATSGGVAPGAPTLEISWSSALAYSDGNSVDLTPEYGFNISSPTGIPSGGYPVTLAIAFKAAVNTTNVGLIGIQLSSGNHWVRIRLGTGLSGESTVATVEMSTRSGAGGSEVNQSSTATISEDTWSVVVVKFTDADNWKIVIDSNALETITTAGGASPSGLNTLYFANSRGFTYFDGSVAWGAVWFSELSDANMQSIAAGTTPPSDHAPDELIYFEGTTAIEGENGSTVNQAGAGSIAVDNTDPAGWPPEAEGGGGLSIPIAMSHYMRLAQ